MKASVAEHIARSYDAFKRCLDRSTEGDADQQAHWADMAQRHKAEVERLVRKYLPSGGGFDNGTTLVSAHESDGLKFRTSFHHMNENGCYSHWTEHGVRVRASLVYGLDVRVTGGSKDDRECVGECFHDALTQEVV